MLWVQSHLIIFFFFQAEDGIRDIGVTGVQTCALPIYRSALASAGVVDPGTAGVSGDHVAVHVDRFPAGSRSSALISAPLRRAQQRVEHLARYPAAGGGIDGAGRARW